MMKRAVLGLVALLTLANGVYAVGTGTLDKTNGWYAAGSSLTVTATPGADSEFTSWTGDTSGATINGAEIILTINAPKSITATFSHIKHDIVASAGANGSISPSGTVSVEQGANQAFSITPDLNCHIVDVLVDSVSVGVPSGFTFTNVQAAHTIAASFAIDQHTITFDSAGGTAVASITDDVGATVTAPADPTKTGYTFTGWSPAVPATMPASDVTCTAQWSINQYTITFNSDGGSAVSPITQNYGTSVTPPADPTKTGHSFTGWSPLVPSTIPASNVTCTAQWLIDTFTLTVVSAHGTATPSTQVYDWNTSVDASVLDSPVILSGNTTQYVCTGWIGTGSVTSGSGTNTSFTITADSSITWQWQTNYWVDFTVVGN